MKLEDLSIDLWVVDTTDNQLFQVMRIRFPEDIRDKKYPWVALTLKPPSGKPRYFWNFDELTTIRLATDEEIQQKKKELKWESIYRQFGEFRVGDVVCQKDWREHSLFIVQNEQQIQDMKESGLHYMLICPVEKRTDYEY